MGLIQYDQRPDKKEALDTDPCMEEDKGNEETEGEDSHLQAKKRPEQILLSEPRRGILTTPQLHI